MLRIRRTILRVLLTLPVYAAFLQLPIPDCKYEYAMKYTYECSRYGFKLQIPGGMSVNESYPGSFIRIYDKSLDVKISKDISPYEDMNHYFNAYIYKYLLDKKYCEANSISIKLDEYIKINNYNTRLLSFCRIPAKGSVEKQNEYFHALVITDKREFYSFFFRTDSLEKNSDRINCILASFEKTDIKNDSIPEPIAIEPQIPVWNNETADFYNELCSSDNIKWGLFYPNTITRDFSRLESIERKLEYKFPLTLHYIYLGHEFPTEAMLDAYDKGKTVELTMQIMNDVQNRTTGFRHNLNFDVLDGKYDGAIREFARAAKEFRHPFLFRLNNEMNSTWTKYGGIALMCDPDIYIKVWRRIYTIFREEGADNAIWIFNPNDRSYPPLSWNSQISYYPGSDCVQIIGLTGYNTGTYYKNTTGETWRSFKEIYEPLNDEYEKYYGKFPWMITEFACSSTGGDKARWIRRMFRQIGNYPNIKAAIWWSYADYDHSKGGKAIPARRYWLDERNKYLKAFKDGLSKTQKK